MIVNCSLQNKVATWNIAVAFLNLATNMGWNPASLWFGHSRLLALFHIHIFLAFIHIAIAHSSLYRGFKKPHSYVGSQSRVILHMYLGARHS